MIVRLADAMEAIIDYRGKTPVKAERGIPLITAKIVKGGRIEEPTEFIDESTYVERMVRGFPKPGDVVITTEAPMGEVARLGTGKLALGQRLICLRGKPDLLDNGYLKYLLMSAPMQAELDSRGSGSTVVGIKQSELRKLELPLPPLTEQRAIAAVLGALDDKIELNRRMNETLEGIAKALFKSWFVDFDPVRAKMDGRRPAGMDAETAALFPSELEASAIGPVPRGWRVGCLGDVAMNIKRQVNSDNIGADEPYFGLEHMPRKSIALSDWGAGGSVVSNKFRFSRGQILFGKLRPYFHKVGVAPVDGVCSTDILVVEPKDKAYSLFTLGTVSTEDFINFTDTGDGSKMPRTDWNRMAAYPIAIPDTNVAAGANGVIWPMIERIVANVHESRTLAALRDALLPKLISGEIRVPV